ncbi:MAG: hypothetical protein IAC51_09160 [bacterium]|uniref:Uncharacterized protein n=1 Tax=Candidatus Aphodosoma intestinipullorum TaxID=2840674 RepID=A0A940DLL9_9BACT|nr:hypothetical protein [Candidatus Aphodosoma intestinipullorum]
MSGFTRRPDPVIRRVGLVFVVGLPGLAGGDAPCSVGGLASVAGQTRGVPAIGKRMM